MDNIEIVNAVQKIQEYIEENLSEPITLHQLSNTAGYSPWHTNRIFKELTGKTPFEYIRALRLSKAALQLRDHHCKIIDVAMDFVFDSHEGFTRAFTKQFGLSPKKYSNEYPPISLFLPSYVRDYYLTFLKKGEVMMDQKNESKAIFVQVVERPQRKVLLKRGIQAKDYFAYCEEVGCDVWGVLSSVKEALYEPIGMWLPQHLINPNTSEYVQGVELPMDYNKEIPQGFELITLPPCTMMVFQGEPYDDTLFISAISEIWEKIEKFNPEIYGYAWAKEEAPRFQLAPMGYRGYIEAMPVKAINR